MSNKYPTSTKKLRVLWVGHVVPVPQNSGSRVYSAKIVGALSKAGADITFIGYTPDDFDISLLAKLDKNVDWHRVDHNKRKTFIALMSMLPLVVSRMPTNKMIIRLKSLIDKNIYFDVIVLENYASGWAVSNLQQLQRMGSKVVYLSHNDETLLAWDIAKDFKGSLARKVFLFINWIKIKHLENLMLKSSDLIIALTEHDIKTFTTRLSIQKSSTKSLVLTPGYEGPRSNSRIIDKTTPRQVIIMGSARWIAKQMNLETFLKVADKKFAEQGIKIKIIGEMDEAFTQRWKEKLIATEFCGFVPDLSTEFNRSRMGLVVEGTGGGFKMKVLDYIFARLPIAALSGSCQGLPLSVSEKFLIADTMIELVEKIIHCIDDFDLLNSMQDAAFNSALPQFDWDKNGEKLYDKLLHVTKS